jgi:hypothetical protein
MKIKNKSQKVSFLNCKKKILKLKKFSEGVKNILKLKNFSEGITNVTSYYHRFML